MKSVKLVVILVVIVLLVGIGYESGWAKGKEEILPARIGVVSVRYVLENSKKNLQWDKEITAEGEKVVASLQALAKQIEAIKADIETRKPGSSDHLQLLQEAMEKRASLEAKEKFHQQEFALKQHRWTEDMYIEILGVIGKVAGEKELDMVLTKEDFGFPSESSNDLLLIIKTSKVLYHSGSLDITNEVLAALNASK